MNADTSTTPTPTLTGCHVELRVSDLDAARRFYVGQLGLSVLQEAPAIGLLAVRAGDIRLSIFGGDVPGTGHGNVHIVLRATELEASIAQLTRRGVSIPGPVIEAPGFCRYVQLHDPEGNLVEIAQYLRDPLAPV